MYCPIIFIVERKDCYNWISYILISQINNLKSGSIVARKSYNKDIVFVIDKIIGTKQNNKIAILKGLNTRIVADSPLSDLVLMNKYSRK